MKRFAHFIALLMLAAESQAADPTAILDLSVYGTPSNGVRRIYGSGDPGQGSSGTPVSGGFDCDGDGHIDYGFAGIKTSPLGRYQAGEVILVFGNGSISGELDTFGFCPEFLKIAGDQAQETTGTEIWMDDVTGEGLGDLLIGRQNFTPGAGREGAGALNIIFGGPELRTEAEKLEHFDLRSPSTNLAMLEIHGATSHDRLGIWMRGGDVTGDGIADVIVAADQKDGPGQPDRGAVYVIRGGTHLATNGTIDLADFGSPDLIPHVAVIYPPTNSTDYHLGSTLQAADLDKNGRAEILMSAALARSGAALCQSPPCNSSGGAPRGKAFIAWDGLFPTNDPWTNAVVIDLGAPSSTGCVTVIQGDDINDAFGEELLAGLDYDGNGLADIFVGDIVADTTNGNNSGAGHVFYDIVNLKGADFSLTDVTLPTGAVFTLIEGPRSDAIGGDTATHGDYDLDGYADLVFGNPNDWPGGRPNAGSMHVIYGQKGGWPASISTAEGDLPPPSVVRIIRIDGREVPDMLCYSADAGDVNKDGRIDLIVNEMVGDGAGGTPVRVGNLIVISAAALASPELPIADISITGSTVEVTTPMINGETYFIACSTNLLTDSWAVVTNGLQGTNVAVTVDVLQGDNTDAYYRVGMDPKSYVATNRDPVAKYDLGNTTGTTAVIITVLANDSDPDGDTPILETSETNSVNGGSIVTNAGGTVTYIASNSFSGLDAFYYTIVDGNGGSMTGCVNVLVSP